MKQSPKEIYWRKQVDRFTASAMTRRAFCKEQNYSVAALDHWRKRLTTSREEKSAFVPVQPKKSPTLPLPTASPSPASTLKVCFPNGISIVYTGRIENSLIAALAAIRG